MNETLVGRDRELGRLQGAVGAARSGRPQLVVLFGRRRVGKTFLVRHLLDRLPADDSAVYFAALRGRPRDEAARLASELARTTGSAPAPDWPSVFAAMVEAARSRLLVVAIDEAPYLIDDDPSWASALQHAWDAAQISGPCHLLICLTGSAISTLSRLISSGGPLFGRSTERLRLDPFDLPTAHRFLGGSHDPLTTVEAYAACGGYPLLLRQWDVGSSAGANLERLASDPLAPLASDANTLLLDLPDPTGYRSVLSAIGRRRTKRSEINSELGQRTDRALGVLEATGLIRREHPVDDRSPKGLRYRLADPYLSLWFRLIDPNQQAIDVGQGRQVVRRFVGNEWQRSHIGEVFEEQARAHAARLVALGALPEGIVGRWWTDRPIQAELDVVLLAERWELVGEAKWTDRFGPREWSELKRNRDAAGDRAARAKVALWVKGSVDPSVRLLAEPAWVFGPADMVTDAGNPKVSAATTESS